MTRHPITHPSWCGQGHVCSADRPAGEHRSQPVVLYTGPSRLVITRIRTIAGTDRLEVRAVLALPTNPRAARAASVLAVWRLHHLIRTTSRGGRP